MEKRLILFGTAEIAELAKFYFDNDSPYTVCGFTVDDEYIKETTLLGLPIIPFSEIELSHPSDSYYIHVALSYAKLNTLRAEKFFSCKKKGYIMPSYISSRSVYWNDLILGSNCFILENQTLQPNVRLGDNVVLWSGNHIGHGTSIGDHTYVSSHVVFSGHCTVGEKNFFGVNSTVKDFCTIGDECFVGMNSIVTNDLASGSVVLPAKCDTLDALDRKAKALKRAYFKV
jgi:sugar O-acyltransferase (sialic acid O-acetyltransferase NeuD family)